MDYLIYFIIGIVFVQWIIPICEAVADLIVTLLEALKYKIGISTAKSKATMESIIEPKKNNQLIGFVAQREEEKDNDL